MVQSPCKNCPERHVACHSSCEKYINYRKTLESDKDKIKQVKDYENGIRSFKINQIEALNKRTGRKK